MKLKNIAMASILALIVALPIRLNAAETVHLFLKANGMDVRGDSSQVSLGRENSIECTYYENKIGNAGTDSVAGKEVRSTGEIQYQPIIFRKRIDKSSPYLIKAAMQNQIVQGSFKFYRPNPTGDGTTEQFYTVEIQGGRIESIKQYVPDTINPESSDDPPMEEIVVSYSAITYTFLNNSVKSKKAG